jgi:two-component system KDP operon response regulator KdpE
VKTLLVVDDDQTLLEALKLYLEREGYQVATAAGGKESLRRFYETRPDLVILDIMMPRMDGWQVCERIREMSDVPIIMLTARTQEDDRVRGLTMGADDYVAKPFSMRELGARVDAVLRRWQSSQQPRREGMLYADGYLVIDAERTEVRCAGRRVDLTATEQQLLFFLARNRGRLLTARQILTNVWGFEYVEETAYVRLYIWRVRQKIEPTPESPRYILTEHGMGYRFVGIA